MSLAHPCYRSLFSHEYGVLIAAFGLLLSLLLGPPTEAAEPNTSVVRFENPLSRVEATSQQLGGINTIVQDSYGFIWMGGENGVARYDGHKLRVYQADPQNPRTLPSSYTTGLAVDQDGSLWQATEGGLSRYHPETDDFTRIRSLGDASFAAEAVVGLAVAQDNTLYVGSTAALHAINPERTEMSVYPFGADWDSATGAFTHFQHNPDDPRSLRVNIVVDRDREPRPEPLPSRDRHLQSLRPQPQKPE